MSGRANPLATIVNVPLQRIRAAEVFPARRTQVRCLQVVALVVPLPVMRARKRPVALVAGEPLDARRRRERRGGRAAALRVLRVRHDVLRGLRGRRDEAAPAGGGRARGVRLSRHAVRRAVGQRLDLAAEARARGGHDALLASVDGPARDGGGTRVREGQVAKHLPCPCIRGVSKIIIIREDRRKPAWPTEI